MAESALRTDVAKKVITTVVIGGVPLVIGLIGGLSLGQSIVVGLLIGGMNLVVNFLMDFEHRLDRLESAQDDNLTRTRKLVGDGYDKVGAAARLYDSITDSMFTRDEVSALLADSTEVNRSGRPMIKALARHEIERQIKFFSELNSAEEITYDGEDREWLLGLARQAESCIYAISLSEPGTRPSAIDGGLWTSDLGYRYLHLQEEAVKRRPKVDVRRIFVFSGAEFMADEAFRAILRRQKQAGVKVRTLDVTQKKTVDPEEIVDYIVFDNTLTYEMSGLGLHVSATRSPQYRTRLLLDPKHVQARTELYQRLWQAADDLPADLLASA